MYGYLDYEMFGFDTCRGRIFVLTQKKFREGGGPPNPFFLMVSPYVFAQNFRKRGLRQKFFSKLGPPKFFLDTSLYLIQLFSP